jgi:hypothetical protein
MVTLRRPPSLSDFVEPWILGTSPRMTKAGDGADA